MLGAGSGREEKFIGPINCVEHGTETEFRQEEPPLTIYYQRRPAYMRAAILLHLLCPLNVRILPGASVQGRDVYEESSGFGEEDSLLLIAHVEEGLGYFVCDPEIA